MPQKNRSNLPDLLRAMPVKVSLKDGKISKLNYDWKEVGVIE